MARPATTPGCVSITLELSHTTLSGGGGGAGIEVTPVPKQLETVGGAGGDGGGGEGNVTTGSDWTTTSVRPAFEKTASASAAVNGELSETESQAVPQETVNVKKDEAKLRARAVKSATSKVTEDTETPSLAA